ncbi:hypothetical protein ACU4GD_18945 [Cupriavidus basilensis]
MVLSFVVFGILGYGAVMLGVAVERGGCQPDGESSLLAVFSDFNRLAAPTLAATAAAGRGDMAALQDGMAYAKSLAGAGLLLTIALVIPFLTFINGTFT